MGKEYTYKITGQMTEDMETVEIDESITISQRDTTAALAAFLVENEQLQFFGTLKTCNADDPASGAIYIDQNEGQKIEIELI